MNLVEPPIPLSEAAGLAASRRKALEEAGISDVAQLFLEEGKLRTAQDLTLGTEFSVREALKVRQIGRDHLRTLLGKIAAKQKVEPLKLLWKIHWLLGLFPEGSEREEALSQEGIAIDGLLENLDQAPAQSLDQILILLLHRTLIVSDKQTQLEINRIVNFAERYQRKTLLAYKTLKVKTALQAIVDEEPAQRIVHYREIAARWKDLQQVLAKRKFKIGQSVLDARKATDNLKILDLSEEHLKDRIQQQMTPQKLRQSQLQHITTVMNSAVELRDSYLAAIYAKRAAQTWFELAQGKSGQSFTDDLSRSFRFTRTAIFHYRALDDIKNAVKLLDRLLLIIGEVPAEDSKVMLEATIGLLHTFTNTIPFLDRPIDVRLLLKAANRVERTTSSLLQKISNEKVEHQLVQLQVNFQRVILNQLEKLDVDPTETQEIQRGFIRTLISLADILSGEEREELLTEAANRANQIIVGTKPKSAMLDQDLETITSLTSRFANRPFESLNDTVQQLIRQSQEIVEARYFQAKDPKTRAQMAFQLLLSKLAPDSSGQLPPPPSSKELDKLEEFASTALVAHAKAKNRENTLKAGALLVWLLLQQFHLETDEEKCKKIITDSIDFVEKTFSFMPAATDLKGDSYRFALLLLRSISELVQSEPTFDEAKWEHLLTESESLAQTLTNVADKRKDIENKVLALNAAATAAAELATLSSSKTRRAQLLTRATKQMKKALQVASTIGSRLTIESTMIHYTQIMRARLKITRKISKQITIFEEWKNTSKEASESLQRMNALDLANYWKTLSLLNAEIPLILAQSSQGKMNLEKAKGLVTRLLQEANQHGNDEQADLAKQLERRWAFQLDEDTLLASGYRLENAETSFTLADEHFRLSLQVEPRLIIDKETQSKERSFPYLRPSITPENLIWYSPTPILASTYLNDDIITWLTLENPTEKSVSIRFSVLAARPMHVSLSLEILGVETLSQDPKEVMIRIAGADLRLPTQPQVAEHREDKGMLIFELTIDPEHSVEFPIQISLK